jgi:hypothetical protein
LKQVAGTDFYTGFAGLFFEKEEFITLVSLPKSDLVGKVTE